MKATISKIFIIGLTLVIFSLLSTSGQSGTLYRCVNYQGLVLLTDSPTDPDFKCTFAASFKDLTPQERAKEQREMEADRQRVKAAVEKQEKERRAEVEKQDLKRQVDRNFERAAQDVANRKASQARNEELAIKSKERMEKTERLSKEFWGRKINLSREEDKRLHDEYIKAVNEDPRAIKSTMTIKIKGGR